MRLASAARYPLFAGFAALGLTHGVDAATYTALDIKFADPAPYDVAQGRPASPQFGVSRPSGLNNAGDVVGNGFTGFGVTGGNSRAGYYNAAAATLANLGNLAGDYGDPAGPNAGGSSAPYGINDAGWVVGYSGNSPMIWSDTDGNQANTAASTEMQALAFNPGATIGDTRGVSNTGYVVVTGNGTNSSASAYLTRLTQSAGVFTEDISRYRLTSSAIAGGVAINDAGHVAYSLQGGGGAYVYRDLDGDNDLDAGETFEIPRMSGFGSSRAYNINNAGQVLGTMKNANNKDVAFIWTDLDGDNAFTWSDDGNGLFDAYETSAEVVRFSVDDVGGIDTEEGNTFAFGLNDQGQAVGGYAFGSVRQAWLYDPTEGISLLDDLIDGYDGSFSLRQATNINNNGQIAAYGRRSATGSNEYAFLLTAVPEPSTAVLLALPAVLDMARRRRK